MAIQIDVKKPEALQVTIWGKTYDLQMGEAYIVDRWLTLSVRADAFLHSKKKDTAKVNNDVLDLLHDLQTFVDEMLGNGAAYELFGKTPVSLVDMINLIRAVVQGATKGYGEKLSSYD